MEQENIIQTVSAIFSGADEHNWQKVQDALADEVLLDYSVLSGNPASTLTSKQIVDAWKGFLPGFDKTHHQLSKFEVFQNGDAAKVHFYGKADHFIDREVWTVEATYDAGLSKSSGSWKVTALTLNLLSQSGNTGLPAEATKRMSK
jgi:hypothetical protein